MPACAGRTFSAADGRVLEILMSDGTTLRLAPGSRLTIEDYSFDEASRAGGFAVRVEAGTVRITGGRPQCDEPDAGADAGWRRRIAERRRRDRG